MKEERSELNSGSGLQSTILGSLSKLKEDYDALELSLRKAIDAAYEQRDTGKREQDKRDLITDMEEREVQTRDIACNLINVFVDAGNALRGEQVEILGKELLLEMEKIFSMMRGERDVYASALNKAGGIAGIKAASKAFCSDMLDVLVCLDSFVEEVKAVAGSTEPFVGVPNVYMNPEYHRTDPETISHQLRVIDNGKSAYPFTEVRFRLAENGKEEALKEANEVVEKLNGAGNAIRAKARWKSSIGCITIRVEYRSQKRKEVLDFLMPKLREWMLRYEGIEQ